MQEAEYQDGEFDKDDIFLIFEADDLRKLVSYIETSIAICEEGTRK